eukprot:FR739896.1.p1 GENE.FR739896.1~~FR739896.1.p1  ORF type:complete len:156 (-),score=18.12 FR739896.1:47-514(-)
MWLHKRGSSSSTVVARANVGRANRSRTDGTRLRQHHRTVANPPHHRILWSSMSFNPGKWIRPCSTNVPQLDAGEELTITVKAGKRRAKKASKFFSATSFLSGAKNNLIGMVGFVVTRRKAKKNFEERMKFEDMLAQKVREKQATREAAANSKSTK